MNDSIWAVVAGIVKAYNLPIDYVLYDMSYANMILYGAVLPSYGGKDSKQQKETIKADDPRNGARIRQLINSFE